jgi:hypothetical protein
VTYQEELARQLEKRPAAAARNREFVRACSILGEAGWNASREQLEAAAEKDKRIEEHERAGVVARAIEIQNDPTVRGRQIRPEDEATMPQGQFTPRATREKIREYVVRRRSEDRKLKAAVVHAEVLKKFDIEISSANFYATYWAKAKPNGKRPAPKAAAPETGTTEAVPPVEESAPTSAAEVPATVPAQHEQREPETQDLSLPATPTLPPRTRDVTPAGPFLSLSPLTDGSVLVRLELATDPAGAGVLASLIGQALAHINRRAAA